MSAGKQHPGVLCFPTFLTVFTRVNWSFVQKVSWKHQASVRASAVAAKL